MNSKSFMIDKNKNHMKSRLLVKNILLLQGNILILPPFDLMQNNSQIGPIGVELSHLLIYLSFSFDMWIRTPIPKYNHSQRKLVGERFIATNSLRKHDYSIFSWREGYHDLDNLRTSFKCFFFIYALAQKNEQMYVLGGGQNVTKIIKTGHTLTHTLSHIWPSNLFCISLKNSVVPDTIY